MGNLNPTNPTGGNPERSIENVELGKSKLAQVLEGLQARGDVLVAGVITHPHYGAGWEEAVDIIIAPIKPIYDVEKLNQFMDGLIPNIDRTAKDDASSYMEDGIKLGKLYFDEDLALVKEEIRKTVTPINLDLSGELSEKSGIYIVTSKQSVRFCS